MSEKEKVLFFQKIKKIFVATISLIILIISLWIIFDCFKTPADTQKQLLSYNSSSNVDYKVYLKPNKFYETSFLGKDKKYISKIIKYIDLNLSYLFNANKQLNTNYSYDIIARIVSEYEVEGKSAELWSKSYVLKKSGPLSSSSSSYRINENIKIDYGAYEALATKFKEAYGVSADTKLVISLSVKSSSILSGNPKPITVTKEEGITIPLNKAVTDITIDGAGNENKNMTETIKGQRNINYVLLVISICLTAVFGPLCFIAFYKLFKITNVSQYMQQQKRILKGYGDIIAEVTTKPDLRGLKVVEVKSFEDLINIEEELRCPILFYELEKEDEAWFIITTESQAYMYILKSSSHLKYKY